MEIKAVDLSPNFGLQNQTCTFDNKSGASFEFQE